MKRRFLLIISFLICSVVASYAETTSPSWSTLCLNNTVCEYNTATKKLTIISTGYTSFEVPDKLTYTDNQVYAIDTVDFSNQSNVTSITFCGEVPTTIICKDNPILTSVTIKGTQRKISIKSYDFSGCVSLTKVTNIGNVVEDININNCSSLKQLSIRSNTIATLDVSSCQSLRNLNCEGCTSLTTLVLPSNKNILETVNVSDCSSLQTLNLQDYTNITDISVTGCENLTNLTLPSSNANIRALKFIKYAQQALNVKGYVNLDTLICDSSNVIEQIEVPTSIRYLRIVNLSRMGQIDLSKCSKLNYLNHENTGLHEPGLDQCLNLLWYINDAGYLVNNPARTYHFIHKDCWGTFCWPEKIRSNQIKAYKIVGAQEDDYELVEGLYLEEIEEADPYYKQMGQKWLDAGTPYIIKFLSDTVMFNRERNTFVDTITVDNYLVGTYSGLTLSYNESAPTAIIKSGNIWDVDSNTGYSIPGYSAYINLSSIPTDIDSSIYVEIQGGINDLKSNIENRKAENGLVDVYSIHGVKVRNDVNAEDATTGLPRGAYIVNGKIVIK